MTNTPEFIMSDRLCSHCEYNLRGLPSQGKCPECGTPIKKLGTKSQGTMSSEAPTSFVRKLRTGFLLATVGMIGEIVLFVPGTLFFTSLWWVSGVWLVTSTRPGKGSIVPDKVLDDDRLRKIIRYASFAWPIYGLAMNGLMFAMSGPNGAPVYIKIPLMFAIICSGSVAWISLIPTCVYFAELSYWASHDRLAQRLRATAWSMAVFGVLTVVLTAIRAIDIPASDAAALASLFTGLLLLISVIVFFIAVAQLTSVMGWVIKHQELAAGSSERVLKRIEQSASRSGVVNSTLNCECCGYDLNGLPLGGRCPECGESFSDQTQMPILDPAKMYQDRDESEIEVEIGENKGIYFNQELDAFGKPKSDAIGFEPTSDSDSLDGDIPLSDSEDESK